MIKRNNMRKKILFAVIALAVLGGAYGYYEYNRPVASIEKKKADIVLSASDLLAAYEADEAAANIAYTEKIIQVTGVISELVSKESGNKIFIETNNPMSGVICEMEDGLDISTLKTGETVTVKGRCTGFLSDVVLVQSSLVQ